MDQSTNDPGNLHIALLGCFSVEIHGAPQKIRPSTARLLAFLATHGPVERTLASGILWPDHTEARARANLRNALWRAQSDCPALTIEDRVTLRLRPFTSDLGEVREWCASISRGEVPGKPPLAIGLDLLPGWEEEWLILAREQLRLNQLHSLETAARSLLAASRFGEAAKLAHQSLAMDPLRESANEVLIKTHLAQNNHVAGLRHFRHFSKILEEFGVRPSSALLALMGPLLSQYPR